MSERAGCTLYGPHGRDDRLELASPPPEDDVLGQTRHVGTVARIRIHDYKDDAVFFLTREQAATLAVELQRLVGPVRVQGESCGPRLRQVPQASQRQSQRSVPLSACPSGLQLKETPPVPPEELDAIEARVKAATEGPWTAVIHPVGFRHLEANGQAISDTAAHPMADADILFCAHARQDVPALVAEVRRLQGLVKQAEWFRDSDYGNVCPWCDAISSHPNHSPTCVAFAGPGKLRTRGLPPDTPTSDGSPG